MQAIGLAHWCSCNLDNIVPAQQRREASRVEMKPFEVYDVSAATSPWTPFSLTARLMLYASMLRLSSVRTLHSLRVRKEP